jgi:nucleoside-diphosphate-sugar epimerase
LIGRACARHLAESGFEVIGLSRRRGGDPALADEIEADLGSAAAAETIDAATESCDAIVHAAASRDPSGDSLGLVLTNCLGTQQALALAREWGSRRFVFISGVHVVGRPRETPIRESHPAAPVSAYHVSKLFGERLVEVAADRLLNASVLRVSAPVGPSMSRDRVLPTFIAGALAGEPLVVAGRGTRRQNYVHVRDVARAVELALDRDVTGLFNVAGPTSISNRELAERCVGLLDSPSRLEYRGEDPEEGVVWDVSIEKARRELSYVPDHGIDDTIRELAAVIGHD